MPHDITPIRGGEIINSSLPFSPGIRAGDYVFVSGMASADENGVIIHDEFENEARRTYENLGRVLRGATRGRGRQGSSGAHLPVCGRQSPAAAGRLSGCSE